MKIAFVTPAYYPATMGAALYSTELAENLARKGHEIAVFTPWQKGLEMRETINGIEIKRIPRIQLTESYIFSAEMIRQILRERFDIIHSHHYGYFPATAGFVAAKLRKTPHVFGPYYHPPIYGGKRWLMFSAYHMTQGLPILRCSDAVLPHTEYEKLQLLKVGAREENMRILPNIVNTRKFVPGRKENIVLFVSSLIYEKGAHIALNIAEDILKERKDVKFVFIGNPQEALLNRIEKLGRNKNIRFLRNLPLKDLISWYQRAKVIFLPSRYEAFARVLAEAEACGCVAVATRAGGIRDVVKDGETGYLVEYGEWGKMKEKILFLIDNPEKAARMGKSAVNHVRRNFDTGIIVKRLVKVYEEVA